MSTPVGSPEPALSRIGQVAMPARDIARAVVLADVVLAEVSLADVALPAMRLDANDDRDPGADALGHHAEVLEELQASPDARLVAFGDLRKELDVERTDPEALSLVAHERSACLDTQAPYVDARFPGAEQE